MHEIKNIGKKAGTIIYIHGNSSSSQVFLRTINSIKIEYTQIAIDLPGHGKSQKHYCESYYSLNRYSEVLTTRINEIEDDILLVGNSLGGHLAMEIASGIKRLKGLVIFGAPPVKKPINFSDAFLQCEALNCFLTENPEVEDIKFATETAVFDNTFAELLINDFKNTDPKVRLALAKDLMDNNWSDQKEIFISLPVPKFIFKGSHDPSVNPVYLEKIIAETNDQSSIIDFKNCGHFASIEQEDRFIESIASISKSVFKV